MARIKIKNVVKSWGDFVGVKDASIDIQDKEFLVLLGPSGCGKTTTMRMIAGLETPTSGEILIDEEIMNDVDARDRDVAMVFQGYALYPNMTVYENIRFPLRMRGVPKREQAEHIHRAADMVEMTSFLDRKPGALSGGQRQRAALARAVVRSPKVFLMDEPLSNLDAKLRHSMRVQLKLLQNQLETTTVYVTHDQVEAMTLADRIVVMNGGEIQQIGTPDQIYQEPENTFVASFIGSPPMNLFNGELVNGTFSCADFSIKYTKKDHSGPVQLGVRPEDCSLVDPDGRSDVRGEVYGYEPTGDVTYLTIKCKEHIFDVKADRRTKAKLGDQIGVSFHQDSLYLFNSQNGIRLKA